MEYEITDGRRGDETLAQQSPRESSRARGGLLTVILGTNLPMTPTTGPTVRVGGGSSSSPSALRRGDRRPRPRRLAPRADAGVSRHRVLHARSGLGMRGALRLDAPARSAPQAPHRVPPVSLLHRRHSTVLHVFRPPSLSGMMCSLLAESPVSSASQMTHVVMARLLRLCTTLPRGRLPAPLLATTDFHCLLENGIGTMSGSLRLPNRFSSRRNPTADCRPARDGSVELEGLQERGGEPPLYCIAVGRPRFYDCSVHVGGQMH